MTKTDPAPDTPTRRRRVRRPGTLMTMLLVLALVVPTTAAAAAGTATVHVFFTPAGGGCGATAPYVRTVATPRVATGAVEQLLAGPTAAERGAVSSLFGASTAGMLRSVVIRDGVAHVDLRDLRAAIPGASSSCGSASLLAQLDATVTQFPTVQRARYSINGSEAAFSHWLQRDVPEARGATRGSLRNTAPIRNRHGAAATLREVRTGRHAGFDRVVFEFSGGVPAYGVRFTPVVRLGGSGAPFPVRGTVALQVDLQASSVDMDDPAFTPTFRPRRPLVPGLPTLREVRWGGEFEGLTTFAVGLAGRSGFRVLELSGPPRLVVDVAHGATVRTLRRGHRGVDVRDWQARLNTAQFGQFATSPSPASRPLALDGVFGPRTAQATRILQRREGVAVTGVVDARTRDALHRALQRVAP